MASKLTKLHFCTSSSYDGTLNADHQMHGFGVYQFADGSVYEGYFRNGEFHGDGVIILPSKFKLHGIFAHGKCTNYKMEFADGIEYRERDWEYCVYPDRRYAVSIANGIPPVGGGHKTSHDPPRELPEGFYDTEEGFFTPDFDYLWSAEDPSVRIRGVSPNERRWAMKYFRHTKKEPVGFQQDIVDENVLALHELFGPEGPQVSCSTSSDSAETKFFRDGADFILSPPEKLGSDTYSKLNTVEYLGSLAFGNSAAPQKAESAQTGGSAETGKSAEKAKSTETAENVAPNL